VPAGTRPKTKKPRQKPQNPAVTLGFVVLVPVAASQCQTRAHSHSIVNGPIKSNNGAGLELAGSVDTMKNTMIKNN